MSFYKRLNENQRVSFLTDLFYVARFDPSYYFPIWFSVLALLLFFFGLFFFLYGLVVVVFWYFWYFFLLYRFVYKWKKKHLYTS